MCVYFSLHKNLLGSIYFCVTAYELRKHVGVLEGVVRYLKQSNITTPFLLTAWYRRCICSLWMFKLLFSFQWAAVSGFLLVGVVVVSSFNKPNGWCRKARVCFQIAVNVLAGLHPVPLGRSLQCSRWEAKHTTLPEEMRHCHWSASTLVCTAGHYGRLAGWLSQERLSTNQFPAAFRQVSVVIHDDAAAFHSSEWFLFKLYNYVYLCPPHNTRVLICKCAVLGGGQKGLFWILILIIIIIFVFVF